MSTLPSAGDDEVDDAVQVVEADAGLRPGRSPGDVGEVLSPDGRRHPQLSEVAQVRRLSRVHQDVGVERLH